jgi:hypothetical protein
MSSIHGLLASPFKAGYISAKHGLIGLTRAAALEGGQYGVTVNAICPGWTRTPLVEGQLHDLAQAQGVPFNEVLDRVGLAETAIKRLRAGGDRGAGGVPHVRRRRGDYGNHPGYRCGPHRSLTDSGEGGATMPMRRSGRTLGEHDGGCRPVLHQTKAAANRLRQAPKRFTPAAGRHATRQCSDIDIVCRAVPN